MNRSIRSIEKPTINQSIHPSISHIHLARKGKDDIGLDGCEMKSVEELEASADPKGIAAVDGLVGATLEPLRLPEAQPTLQLLRGCGRGRWWKG